MKKKAPPSMRGLVYKNKRYRLAETLSARSYIIGNVTFALRPFAKDSPVTLPTLYTQLLPGCSAPPLPFIY